MSNELVKCIDQCQIIALRLEKIYPNNKDALKHMMAILSRTEVGSLPMIKDLDSSIDDVKFFCVLFKMATLAYQTPYTNFYGFNFIGCCSIETI
jgi:hypothetical protein